MNTPNRLFTVLTFSLLLFSQASYATEADSSAEHIGFGGGAIVGAALGGPLGAILGASLGAYLGDSQDQLKQVSEELVLSEAEQMESLTLAQDRQHQLKRIKAQLVLAEHEIEELHGKIEDLFVDQAVINGLEFALYFDTDEADYNENDIPKLVSLAKLLARMPKLIVELHGHADSRGSDSYNQTLSLDRAYAVADTLVSLGVDQSQLKTYAFGETRTNATQAEELYQDRRVSLRIGVIESEVDAVATDLTISAQSEPSTEQFAQ